MVFKACQNLCSALSYTSEVNVCVRDSGLERPGGGGGAA